MIVEPKRLLNCSIEAGEIGRGPAQRQRLNGVLTRPGCRAAGRAMADGYERPARGVADVDACRCAADSRAAPCPRLERSQPDGGRVSSACVGGLDQAADLPAVGGEPGEELRAAGPGRTGRDRRGQFAARRYSRAPASSRRAAAPPAWRRSPPWRGRSRRPTAAQTAAHPAATRSASPIAAGRAGRARGRRSRRTRSDADAPVVGRGRRTAGRAARSTRQRTQAARCTFGRGTRIAGRGRCTFGRGMRTAGRGTLGRGRPAAGRVPFARGCPFRRSEGARWARPWALPRSSAAQPASGSGGPARRTRPAAARGRARRGLQVRDRGRCCCCQVGRPLVTAPRVACGRHIDHAREGGRTVAPHAGVQDRPQRVDEALRRRSQASDLLR